MKQIHSVVWKENDLFVAKALEVEVASQGMSENEAIRNLEEALELYFEDNSDQEITKVSQPRLQEIPIQLNA